MAASISVQEAAADCPYINDYCNERHRGVVKCSWTVDKGRILTSEASFRQGEIIFREPPLHIVAEQKNNPAFRRLKELCDKNGAVFEYETLWYWTALCSLKQGQLGPEEERLKPIDEDKQRKLLLLYHSDVAAASEASKQLVLELGLSYLEPIDLERLLQIWILNCFEHSDDPLGYSTYFMSSFMSHSCLPNAVWHYDGDDFVLRARCAISAQDEITVSYLSEDALLESISARRKHLKDSKHFVCQCERCNAERDYSRGFRCPACPGVVFAAPTASNEDGIEGAACGSCGHVVKDKEAMSLSDAERDLEGKLEGWERRMERGGRGKYGQIIGPVEAAIALSEGTLAQHWLLDKAWQLLAELYDKSSRPRDAEELVRRRIAFQESAYPGLSGTRAWTLEAFGDMLLRHSGAIMEPQVKLPSKAAALQLASTAPRVYSDSLDILRLMFGEQHDYYICVQGKATGLHEELKRHLGSSFGES